MSEKIISRPVTKEYRDGWERIYGGSQSEPAKDNVLLFKQRYRQLHPKNTAMSIPRWKAALMDGI